MPQSPALLSTPVRPALATDRAQGFTLIEVLVTLAILSVGLLGLAALQIQGLRGTHDALLQTQAGVLTVAMAERLRAEPLAAQDTRQWQTQLAERLPAGDGSVTTDTATVTVQVRWNDRGTPQHYDLSYTP